MRFLRTSILAIGLAALTAGCGGKDKGPQAPADPVADPADDPTAEPTGDDDDDMPGDDDPCGASEDDPCGSPDEGVDE
jgi:hypothetical protein